MKTRNRFASLAFGIGLSLLVATANAQRDAGADADVPESAGENTPAAAIPKAFAPNRRSANTAPGSSRNANRPRSSVQTFRATNLIGTSITNAEGQAVGKVVDFVMDAQGNVLYPLVSYSGTPGYSGKLFAIPYGSLRFGADANNGSTAQLSFDPRLLQRAPNFGSSGLPDFADPVVQTKLNSFYGGLLPTSNAVAGTDGTTGLADGTRVSTAVVNPALPLTSGPPTLSLPGASVIGPSGSPAGSTFGASVTGPSGSPAGSTLPGGSIVGSSGAPGGIPHAGTANGTTGSPPASAVPGASVIGPTGSPAASTSGEGSVIGPTGSPASGTPMPAGNTAPGVTAGTNSSLFPERSSTLPGSTRNRASTGRNASGQLFPRQQNQVPTAGPQPPGSAPPGARVSDGPSGGMGSEGAPNVASPSNGASGGSAGAGSSAGGTSGK
jgi:hypothetical protein